MPEYMFNAMPSLKQKLRRSGTISLFLDYDGTLVRFASRPEGATPTLEVRRILKRLLANPRVRPVIITGRSLKDIMEIIGMEGLDYIGFHGFESRVCGKYKSMISAKNRSSLRKIRDAAEREFAGIDGIWIEDKMGASVNFHYRDFDGEPEKEKERFIDIVRSHGNGSLRVIGGSRILEALPGDRDKGKAVTEFLERHAKDSLPLYFGDDMTDEDAFDVLKGRGITIYVRNGEERRTLASFFVENPGEVLKALAELFPDLN